MKHCSIAILILLAVLPANGQSLRPESPTIDVRPPKTEGRAFSREDVAVVAVAATEPRIHSRDCVNLAGRFLDDGNRPVFRYASHSRLLAPGAAGLLPLRHRFARSGPSHLAYGA